MTTPLRRGASLVEFALIMPIVATVMAGVIEYSWYMDQTVNVSRAARDGSRYGAAVYERPDEAPGTVAVPEAQAFALQILDGAGMPCGDGCEVEATYGSSPVETISVSVVYPYEPLFGLIPAQETLRYTFMTAVEVQ